MKQKKGKMNAKYTTEERISFLEKWQSSGLPVRTYCQLTGIKPTTFAGWVEHYIDHEGNIIKPEEMQNPDEQVLLKKIEELEAKVKELSKTVKISKKELERKNLIIRALDEMIDLSERLYHINVRKNSDAK